MRKSARTFLAVAAALVVETGIGWPVAGASGPTAGTPPAAPTAPNPAPTANPALPTTTVPPGSPHAGARSPANPKAAPGTPKAAPGGKSSTPVNDGVPAGKTTAGLLAQAEALSSAARSGADYTRLTGVVARLNMATVTLAQDRRAEARARRAVRVARAGAASAHRDYTGLTAALKSAAIRLYMTGPAFVAPRNVTSADQLLYAASYEQTALSPEGILDRRRLDVTLQKRALTKARAEEAIAAGDARRARAELDVLSSEKKQLTVQLASFDTTTAAAVSSEEKTLAAQASTELISPTSLESPTASASKASPAPADPSPLAPSTDPPTPMSTSDVALQWAFAELGKPYLWGGTGPDAFDCSGLTQFVWAKAGVSIPRVAADQDAWAIPVSLSQLLPGDLVFFGTTDIHHVGIYIGGGLMIDAPHTGTVVQINSIWWSDLAGFGRVHGPDVPVPPHSLPAPGDPATAVVKPAAGLVPSQSAPPPGSHVPGSTVPKGTASRPPKATATTRPGSAATTVPRSTGSPAVGTKPKAPSAPATNPPTSPARSTAPPPTTASPPTDTTPADTTPPTDTTPPSDTTPPTDTTPPSDTTPPTDTTPTTAACPPDSATTTDIGAEVTTTDSTTSTDASSTTVAAQTECAASSPAAPGP